MAPAIYLVVAVFMMTFWETCSVPANSKPMSLKQPLPAVLSRDQTLPVSMTLPAGAMPSDVMAGMNQPGAKTVPLTMNDINTVPSQNPVPPEIVQAGPLSGGFTQYPGKMDLMNNMATSRMANTEQVLAQASPGFQNTARAGQSDSPMAIEPPQVSPLMNMFQGQMMSSVPANIVLMNIQMACQSLQSFVLSTPNAREIMTSVTNMNNMADLFRTTTQCGYPTLSASLRMFLKTCNMFTSCPNPAFVPFPMFVQPMSPPVPYMVKNPTPMPRGTPILPKPQKRTNSTPKVRPAFLTPLTPMAKMFQGMMYGFKSNQFGDLGGQTARSNSTREAGGAGDD